MNRNRQRTYIAALVIGFLICVGIAGALYFLQPNQSNTESEDSSVLQSDHANQYGLASKSFGSQRQHKTTPQKHSFADILIEFKNSSKFDFKRAVLSFLESATEQELINVFSKTLAKPIFIGSFNVTSWIQSVVLVKLVSVNIGTAQSLIEELEVQAATSVVRGAFLEWNRIHRTEAIKLLSTLDPTLRTTGFRGLILGSNHFSLSELLEIGEELGYGEDYVASLFDHYQSVKTPISLSDLKTKFDNMKSSDHLDKILVEREVTSYIRSEGLDYLPEVLALYDSMMTENMPQLDRLVWSFSGSDLVAELAQDDPEGVFERVVRLGEDIDIDLLVPAAKVWVGADPEAFWDRLSSPDLKPVQEQVARSVIHNWCWDDPNLALISLDKFPDQYHDQVYLRIAGQLSRESPIEALELLPFISDWSGPPNENGPHGEFSDNITQNYFRFRRIIDDAAKADPISTIAWMNSDKSRLPDAQKRQHLDAVFRQWAASDPTIAFEKALQAPLEDGKSGVEATVVGWIATRDMGRAIELLPRVREGETKVEAYRTVSWQLIEEDRIPEAIQLGNDLSEQDRERYNQSLATRVGMRTPFDHLIDGIRQLPTQEMQSKSASSAILFSDTPMANDLTDQQTAKLKDYLTDDDKQMVDMVEKVD